MPSNLQDAFLAQCKREAVPVTVTLMNGAQLQGVVLGYDPFTVSLEFDQITHLLYKHAIATISPAVALRLYPPSVE